MNDVRPPFAQPLGRPSLPIPTRQRWQPLRLGLVELFHYDSEEFWFRDGHLLLRGNNGTGKSKVLSLTLPLLLDAQLKSSRVEPDGDSGKKMAWNLLMNSYERRTGYAWIEFGRLDENDAPRYLSLGAGLSAAAGRQQVESWFFMLDDDDDAPRINQDFWLMSPQRVVLAKERLREQLEGRGQVFETAAHYRRAVDERLFHLGPRRYGALMDTLIQLRQPQLSKKPDETALSNALTEALPPLAPELLGDVAEALGQLEEDRRQLEEYQALHKAIERFEARYRVYAGTQSRREARKLRQAQTEFDNASRARGEAQTRLEEAQAAEESAQTSHAEADIARKGARARFETLRADPTMADASRLENAEKDAATRRQAMERAAAALAEADRRLTRSLEETADAEEQAERAANAVSNLCRQSAVHAEAAGVAGEHAKNPLATLQMDELARQESSTFERAGADLFALATGRREQIALLRRRQEEVNKAEMALAQRRQTHDERRFEARAAAEGREAADAEIDRQGRALVESWERHFSRLKQLEVDAGDVTAALASLAGWAATMDGGDPARRLLETAQQQASRRFAELGVQLDSRRRVLDEERQALEDERSHLEAGRDMAPPAPYTRSAEARDARQGAPFWQLIDFRETVGPSQRAGIEAALEASGLLDAWVSPHGRLEGRGGEALLHDTQLMERPPAPHSLGRWLHAAVPPDNSVSAGAVERMLTGIACADDDAVDSEAWISPDGRFRLGALAGTWAKPAAAYIGYAARAAARTRRLAEIEVRLRQVSDELAAVQAMVADLDHNRQQASEERRLAPSDEALRDAHATATACARDAQRAVDKLAEAEAQRREAEESLQALRAKLAADAADLRLPEAPDALSAIEAAVDGYRDGIARLLPAASELRLRLPALQRQRIHEREARNDLKTCEEQLATARDEANEASVRFHALREAVGAKVEELQRKLSEARAVVETAESHLEQANQAMRKAGEARAVAKQQAETVQATLTQSVEARAHAIQRLRKFAGTGLLAAALPHLELPDMGADWTIDPALTLARRAEQALSNIKDDEETWARVQRHINEELTELQRALGALGHGAMAETSDWGLVVHIVYQSRSERPDRLAARLAEEIAQRSELLTARERKVLENHLQAEIASEIHRLLQMADTQVHAINKELDKRRTSTGMRYRLVWEPLSEAEGAPVGLDAARKRLLNTSFDLWSADDRSVVGTMLQQRIAAEREDGGAGHDDGSLLDQLARALDYRRWHRFRVERWQDGHWRRLSGPASSGERALGLTVPLFAAVACFYTHSSYSLAPRLILLDEAFAGIDDTARAHCMGLIHEFDLDFVITSEREWACYAELPGVAICHLQRREDVDAVFVSRWTWNGRARTREADPDRRFAPA